MTNHSHDVDPDTEKIEIALLLEGIFRKYGHDFRRYSYSTMRRRVWHRIHLEGLPTVSALLEKVLHDGVLFHRLLRDLVIPVTEMFRDPDMFLSFRRNVVPILREIPYVRIWHAGCSTGEEAYSMAVLLHEEGLLDKTRIYATDISEDALSRAKEGFIPIDRMKLYTKNYQASGGLASFSDYYVAEHGLVMLKPSLRKNIVFARHNLVTDRSFNEFHVILCRNVMIYFDGELRDRVHGLFHESLASGGFLTVGSKESITFTSRSGCYDAFDDRNRIYRKNP
ncbi:CheR family methyltransferase [Cohnella faecalis]|uniref:Protein-glutamate O-methyltransferase CheR n=1 Tax=Cohnella faecalis TaxID=2315694 RepID=A0A398CKC9_9BACL|nr:protein-glutamate O-methyltransferase CheR [Cohnella faecalis]RIE02612.1 protein-glutamate O-methyltransferase CheR [Cohnella faecalis]